MTEEEYVSDLNTIIEVYMLSCRLMKDDLGITDVDVNAIFSNLEMLKPLHEKFHEDLKARFDEAAKAGEGDANVADVFTSLSSFFKMYMQYCANYPSAVQHLENLEKGNKKFARFIQVSQGNERSKNMTMGSWLIKPVQRLCKYPLLLRELCNHTGEDHPDHESINMARQKINEVHQNSD